MSYNISYYITHLTRNIVICCLCFCHLYTNTTTLFHMILIHLIWDTLQDKITYTVDLVIFACLNFLDFLILRLFTRIFFQQRYHKNYFREILGLANLSSSRNSRKINNIMNISRSAVSHLTHHIGFWCVLVRRPPPSQTDTKINI